MSVIVGIAGGSASGKSTFAAALADTLAAADPPLRAEVLGMDRYNVREKGQGPWIVFTPTGESLFNMNHPEAFDAARLRADIDSRVAAPDAPDVLIVEGLMVLNLAPIRERLDLRLFIELDADVRALRRMLRDMSGIRGNRDPQFIADYYRECARVGHGLYVEPSRTEADLILRGDADFGRTAPLIAILIREKRKEKQRDAAGADSALA